MQDYSNFFESFFNNAREIGLVVMDKNGIIQKVNDAFTNAYGYSTEDLHLKSHRILFTEKDKTLLKPEIEINQTLREGSSGDENYLIHKDGSAIWVAGESVLIKYDTTMYILKVVHNIHAQKQLERYLLASNDLLDRLFNSVKSSLLMLDGTMRVIKANEAFRQLFNCAQTIAEGSRIQEIPHSFWHSEEIKNDIRNALIKNKRLKKDYIIGEDKSSFRKIQVTSKLMVTEDDTERKLLLVVKAY